MVRTVIIIAMATMAFGKGRIAITGITIMVAGIIEVATMGMAHLILSNVLYFIFTKHKFLPL